MAKAALEHKSRRGWSALELLGTEVGLVRAGAATISSRKINFENSNSKYVLKHGV